MNTRVLLSIILVGAVGLSVGIYFAYRHDPSAALDERVTKALESTQTPRMYEMRVDTETTVSGRSMRISGLYRLNFETKSFGSYGTTTLFTPDLPQKSHTFSLDNVSIGDDIYVRIDTKSPLLQKTIPYSPAWRHFTAASIPPQFKNIAVSGPVLDTLALLGEGGSYLAATQPVRDTQFGSSTVHVYSFGLSKKARKVQGGTLQPLIERIASGTVELLVDDTPAVRGVVVRSDNYVSTTTILSVNSPLTVGAPQATD